MSDLTRSHSVELANQCIGVIDSIEFNINQNVYDRIWKGLMKDRPQIDYGSSLKVAMSKLGYLKRYHGIANDLINFIYDDSSQNNSFSANIHLDELLSSVIKFDSVLHSSGSIRNASDDVILSIKRHYDRIDSDIRNIFNRTMNTKLRSKLRDIKGDEIHSESEFILKIIEFLDNSNEFFKMLRDPNIVVRVAPTTKRPMTTLKESIRPQEIGQRYVPMPIS